MWKVQKCPKILLKVNEKLQQKQDRTTCNHHSENPSSPTLQHRIAPPAIIIVRIPVLQLPNIRNKLSPASASGAILEPCHTIKGHALISLPLPPPMIQLPAEYCHGPSYRVTSNFASNLGRLRHNSPPSFFDLQNSQNYRRFSHHFSQIHTIPYNMPSS